MLSIYFFFRVQVAGTYAVNTTTVTASTRVKFTVLRAVLQFCLWLQYPSIELDKRTADQWLIGVPRRHRVQDNLGSVMILALSNFICR